MTWLNILAAKSNFTVYFFFAFLSVGELYIKCAHDNRSLSLFRQKRNHKALIQHARGGGAIFFFFLTNEIIGHSWCVTVALRLDNLDLKRLSL